MPSKKRKSKSRNTLAHNLRRLRKLRGLSQERLAEQAGLHRTYVGSIERSEVNVSLDNIVKLAKALGVTPSQLLESEGYTQKNPAGG